MARLRVDDVRAVGSLAAGRRQSSSTGHLSRAAACPSVGKREHDVDLASHQRSVLSLQRVVGNRALSRLLEPERDPQGLVDSVPRSGGSALPAPVRREYEDAYGTDLRSVRLHTDASAATSAEAWNATAYTAGEHIVFARGAFSPGTTAGRRLLGHELAHVIQQRTGRVTGSQLAGTDLQRSEPGDQFERAADDAAASFLAGSHQPRQPTDGHGPARPSGAGRTVIQGKWAQVEQDDAAKLLSSKYAPIQRVSPAQLTNIALAAVSTLFPDAMWDKVASKLGPRKFAGALYEYQPYAASFELFISMGKKKGKVEKGLHAAGFGSEGLLEASPDLAGADAVGGGLDFLSFGMNKAAMAYSRYSMKKTLREAGEDSDVGEFAFGSALGKKFKLKLDLHTWQMGTGRPLVLGDILFVLSATNVRNMPNTKGVLRVRRGAVEGVEPGGTISEGEAEAFATWWAALKSGDRVFRLTLR